MPSAKVNLYISDKYDSWLSYTVTTCLYSSSVLDPYEVLNHSLCTILEKDTQYVESLIDSSEIDYYVKHIIKTNIISPRSTLRYTKGQHCTSSIDTQEPFLFSKGDDELTTEIKNNIHLVREVFDKLDISPNSKDIFEWKFFKERPFSEWIGPESDKYLYGTYNRIYSILSYKIWKIIGD